MKASPSHVIMDYYVKRTVERLGEIFPLTFSSIRKQKIFNIMEAALSAVIPAVCDLEAERTLVKNFFEAVAVILRDNGCDTVALLDEIKNQSLALC